jgi:hypothetical protein
MYEQEIKQAMKGRVINDIPTKIIIEKLSVVLTRLYLVLGFKVPEMETFKTVIMHLVKTLQTCHKFMTLEEVLLCLEMGSRGNLGEFVGLNGLTLSTWLTKYKNSETRQKVKNDIYEETRLANKKAGEEKAQKLFNFEEAAQHCYESFLKDELDRMIVHPMIFDELRMRNLICISDQKFEAEIEKRNKEIRRKKERDSNDNIVKISKSILDDIVYSATIRTKMQLVVQYFQQLKDFGFEKIPFEEEEIAEQSG